MKYMGSKSRIAKYIVPIIQKFIDDNESELFIEPFVGGANVIDKIRCETKIGSDLNRYLIALLNRAKDNMPLYDEVPKELYDEARDAFNEEDTSSFEDWQIGNIGFLASYNGRWFDGGYAKTGYEKTKNGYRLRDYYQEAKSNLEKQSNNNGFRNCIFECRDYTEYSELDIKNAVFYIDPPYANTKKFKNAINFDYDKFWQWCRDMSEENVVIVSELNAPDDFVCIWEQEVSRSIKADDKRTATEKLFMYNNRGNDEI